MEKESALTGSVFANRALLGTPAIASFARTTAALPMESALIMEPASAKRASWEKTVQLNSAPIIALGTEIVLIMFAYAKRAF